MSQSKSMPEQDSHTGGVRRRHEHEPAVAPSSAASSDGVIAGGTKAKNAAIAAGKRRVYSNRGFARWWEGVCSTYRRMDEVVSVPFLLVLSAILTGVLIYGQYGGPDVGGEVGEDSAEIEEGEGQRVWTWVQGIGKDVVGKVNCTTYLHGPSGAVVELGHGSGGGLSFKVDSKVRWVWHEGYIEHQHALSCPDLEETLKKGQGRPGKPKSRMFNRYNKVFWIGTIEKKNVIKYRNVNNPVSLELRPDGFKFTSVKLTIVSYLNGTFDAVEPSNSTETVEVLNVTKDG